MLDCKKLKVPISDFKIYLLIEESRLKKENPKISTIPAKINKFLVYKFPKTNFYPLDIVLK